MRRGPSGEDSVRSVSARPAFEEFWSVWRELLHALVDPGSAVLVEGERDRAALEALGVRAPIHLVHRGQALPEVAERLARSERRVIVLTDWDAAGGELARRLKELLRDGRLEVDLEFRRRLGIALRGELVHLEGLDRWAHRRAEDGRIPLEEWIADPDRAR